MISDDLAAHAAAADSAALAAAAGSAEEALACQRDALAVLAEGWRSETGSAATLLLQQRCAEATDIVAALNRAAEELRLLRQDWTDLSWSSQEGGGTDGGETPSGPDRAPVSGAFGEVTAPSAEPPTAVSGQPVPAGPWPQQAWPGPMDAGPWAASPPAAAVPSPNWQPGVSAPAGVGAALVGLVAQIAQMLGSYADSPVISDAETSADEPVVAVEPSSPQRNPPEGVDQSAGASSLPDEVVPKSAVPQPLPAAQNPSSDLLAAERPAEPGIQPVPAPPPPVDAPAPSPPAETPCEIAADELANVGE